MHRREHISSVVTVTRNWVYVCKLDRPHQPINKKMLFVVLVGLCRTFQSTLISNFFGYRLIADVYELLRCLDVPRSGNFRGDDRRQMTGRTDYTTPCTCAQGNNNNYEFQLVLCIHLNCVCSHLQFLVKI